MVKGRNWKNKKINATSIRRNGNLTTFNELTYTTPRTKGYSFQLKQAPGSKMIEPPTIHPCT